MCHVEWRAPRRMACTAWNGMHRVEWHVSRGMARTAWNGIWTAWNGMPGVESPGIVWNGDIYSRRPNNCSFLLWCKRRELLRIFDLSKERRLFLFGLRKPQPLQECCNYVRIFPTTYKMWCSLNAISIIRIFFSGFENFPSICDELGNPIEYYIAVSKLYILKYNY